VKILITGNLGYVGPGVTRQLRARYPDSTLIGIDTGYFAHCLTGAARLPEAALDTQIYADIRRISHDVLQGVDAVVHLAAISNDPMGDAYENVTFDVNYRAGADLAAQAQAAGVRSFVFASSCSVYGAADDHPRTERSEVGPITAYAKSKVLLERRLGELAGENFHVTCLRFATACGMSDRLRLDLVLNDFVACALSTKRITVLSDGTPWRPLIHVADMARAVEWALERDGAATSNFLVVNTGSDTWNYQVQELARAVAEVIPGSEVSINRQAPPDRRSYRVDFSLFRSLAPGHQPQMTLLGTIEGLRDGLASMYFDDRNFRSSSLMRLRVLTDLRSRGLLTDSLNWTDKPPVHTDASLTADTNAVTTA